MSLAPCSSRLGGFCAHVWGDCLRVLLGVGHRLLPLSLLVPGDAGAGPLQGGWGGWALSTDS